MRVTLFMRAVHDNWQISVSYALVSVALIYVLRVLHNGLLLKNTRPTIEFDRISYVARAKVITYSSVARYIYVISDIYTHDMNTPRARRSLRIIHR